MICTHCGKTLDPQLTFCPACGYSQKPNPPIVSSTKYKTTGSVILTILTMLFGWFIGPKITANFFPSNTHNIVSQAVKDTKQEVNFPYQIDNITTWTDITSEGSTIRYHYFVSQNINNSHHNVIKKALIDKACTTKEVADILDHGITLEYIYTSTGSTNTVSISVDKQDC